MTSGGEQNKKASLNLDMELQDDNIINTNSDKQDDQVASSFKSFEIFGSMKCPRELEGTLREIESGLAKGLKPILTDDGTSGTWLLRG